MPRGHFFCWLLALGWHVNVIHGHTHLGNSLVLPIGDLAITSQRVSVTHAGDENLLLYVFAITACFNDRDSKVLELEKTSGERKASKTTSNDDIVERLAVDSVGTGRD